MTLTMNLLVPGYHNIGGIWWLNEVRGCCLSKDTVDHSNLRHHGVRYWSEGFSEHGEALRWYSSEFLLTFSDLLLPSFELYCKNVPFPCVDFTWSHCQGEEGATFDLAAEDPPRMLLHQTDPEESHPQRRSPESEACHGTGGLSLHS